MLKKGGGRKMKEEFVRKQVIENLLEEILAGIDDVEKKMTKANDKNRNMLFIKIEKELINLDEKIHALVEKIDTIQIRRTQPVQTNVSFELSI
jgi:hypothetical protein